MTEASVVKEGDELEHLRPVLHNVPVGDAGLAEEGRIEHVVAAHRQVCKKDLLEDGIISDGLTIAPIAG